MMREMTFQADIPAEAASLSLRNYLFWSTMVGIFSVWMVVRLPFAVRMFDGIMIVNLVLMSLIVNMARLPKWVLLFILYLAGSGAIGIVRGTDSAAQASKEFLGISISLLYFCYFFRIIGDDYRRAFLAYAKLAFWFAIIAFPLWAGQCIHLGRYDRLKGLTAEPASFCELVLPALYWYAYQFFTFKKNRRELVVTLAAILLSSSSLGYLGITLGIVLLLAGRRKHAIAIPVVIVGLLVLAYSTSTYVQERTDNFFLAASAQDVGGSNQSTYAVISNLFVTAQVLKQHPFLGNGLGSHVISHERYLSDIPGIDTMIGGGMENLNASEASSLALRSLSEFGVIGFFAVIFFVFRFRVGGTGSGAAISNAILLNFAFKLERDGNYFPAEQFFFIIIYILNHRYGKSKPEPPL